MPTLQQDIDDLDRMVDQGAAKDAIRSQIRLVAHEIAARAADYARLAADHQQLITEHQQLTTQYQALQAAQCAPAVDVPLTEEERILKSIGAWTGR